MTWTAEESTAGGQTLTVYRAVNASGASAAVCDYGARVTRVRVPDREGRIEDVAIGYGEAGCYLGDNPYFGAIVGRVANRVADGEVRIGGRVYPSCLTTARTFCTAARTASTAVCSRRGSTATR